MKILIGYDGSESSDQIFEDLRSAGLPRDTEALIVSVADLLASSPPVSEFDLHSLASRRANAALRQAKAHGERIVNEAHERAAKAADRLRSLFPGWKVEGGVRKGTPGWELIDAADDFKADLIIVGSQGRSGIGRLFLGSVSKKVATNARSSVRVARFAGQNSSAAQPPRVVVGVDGSLAAEQAIYSIGQRVWPAGTEVRLVAVDDSASPAGIAALLPQAARMISGYNQTREERVRSMLEWADEELGNIGLKTSVVREKGDPKKVLLAEARKWNADSIFVGTRDFKNSFERFRLGSVSAAVVTDAHCSVEIVRPPHTAEDE